MPGKVTFFDQEKEGVLIDERQIELPHSQYWVEHPD
jgi:hypothetical protein